MKVQELLDEIQRQITKGNISPDGEVNYIKEIISEDDILVKRVDIILSEKDLNLVLG